MEKNILSEMIVNAYTELKNARTEFFETGEEAIAIREQYDAKRASLIASGKIDGKNSEAREAQLEVLLATETKNLLDAKAKERQAHYLFDIAQISVDSARALLRLEELLQGNKE